MTVSIRVVLLFGFCGLLAVSLAAVAAAGFGGALGNTFTLMAREAEQIVKDAESRLDASLEPVELQAAYLADGFSTGRLTFDNLDRVVQSATDSAAGVPDLAGFVLMDESGRGFRVLFGDSLNGASAVLHGDFSDDSDVISALAVARQTTHPVWRRPVWVEEIGQTVINYHTPLVDPDGTFVGLLIQGRSVADLSSRLIGIQGEDGRMPFLLYDGDRILAHPGLAQLAHYGDEDQPLPPVVGFQDAIMSGFPTLQIAHHPIFNQGTLRFGQTEFAGDTYFFVFREVAALATDKPVTVGLYVNESTYDDVNNRLRWVIIFASTVFLLSVPMALWMTRATVRPIRALAKASAHVAAGSYDSVGTLPVSRMYELNDACRGFERMLDGLKERERIRDLFGRMIPRGVAEILLHSPDGLEPQETEATVLFCDIQDFTQLTHSLGPERVVGMLNAYFTDMVHIVHSHNGIVTQFQGDAVLAVFNVPLEDADHARQAISAAKEMQKHLTGRTYLEQSLKSRIGIATGPLIAANVGAESRMNYTVHGDTVNLAARLEALNKDHGTRILIAESTARQSGGAGLRDLGAIDVRGQNMPVRIFTPEEDGV